MQVHTIQGAEAGVGVGIGVNNNNKALTNKNKNVSFGYNPLVNEELIHTLENSKKNKAFCSYIKNLVMATNKAEIDLRIAEKNNKKKLAGLLFASFIPAKILITDMVNQLFPESNYREHEMISYAEEMNRYIESNQNPPDWMTSVVDVLNEHAKQDQAAYMTNVLESALHQVLPNHRFDLSGLTGAIRQEYIDGPAEEEAVEGGDGLEEDDNSTDNLVSSLNLTPKQRINIGKNSVKHYEPKTKAEQAGFASLGGMNELKETLMKKVITPLRDPVQAKYNEEHYGIKRPNGILFYGPPGSGKTTIAERLSVESGLPLLEMTRDYMGSTFVDGSNIKLGCVFDYAASIATEEKPVILFMDDIDSIFGSRNDVTLRNDDKKELGIIFDRIQDAPKNNIIVVASTNCYDNIDKALLRRLRDQFYVGYLDKEGRKSFFKMKLEELDNGKILANDEKAIDRIADLTESFPISALEDFVDGATQKSEIDFYNHRDIELKDFEEIISKPESQNKKINEDLYKTKATRKSIGF